MLIYDLNKTSVECMNKHSKTCIKVSVKLTKNQPINGRKNVIEILKLKPQEVVCNIC